MNTERDSDWRTKVYHWLEKSGYPLEMTVAQAFRESNCNFHVSQAQYYLDPQDNKPREMDVVVSRPIGQDIKGKRIRLDVCFCIECKSTPDKPWIVFTSERTSVYEIVFGFDFLPPVVSTPSENFVFQLARQGKIQVANMFKPRIRRGYGVTQAFTTGKDIPYEAAMGAVKAAYAMVAPFNEFTTSQPLKTLPVGLAIPVIVVEGGLFECYLEATGKMRVEEIDACSVEWAYPLSLNQSSCTVHIYTKSALRSLIEDADNAAQVLADGMPFYDWTIASSGDQPV